MIAVAVVEGDIERAGVLTGAAEAVRQLTGVAEQASVVTYQPFVASVLRSEAAAVFEAARARGRAMTVREATDFALAALSAGRRHAACALMRNRPGRAMMSS